tara:strand:- start:150 stop:1307 length:1158 start_codon:yes stop_codon:yes gene_type:complete
LDIQNYISAEKKYIKKNPIFVYKNFYPKHLIEHGFYQDIHDLSDIWKYADTMHWHRLDETFKLLSSLTETEVADCKNVIEKVKNITNKYCNKIVLGTTPTLRALLTTRVIEKIQNKDKNNILEIGPGSGMVGAFSLLRGNNYVAIENASPLFYWQNIFLKNFSQNTTDLLDLDNNKDYEQSNFIHIPWWSAVDERLIFKKKFDFIILNHCITEITSQAFNFYIYLIKKFLKDDGKIIVEGWGGGKYLRNATRLTQNFDLVHNVSSTDNKNIVLYDAISVLTKKNQHKKISQFLIKRKFKSFFKRINDHFLLKSFEGGHFQKNLISELSNVLKIKPNISGQSKEEFLSYLIKTYGKNQILNEDEHFTKKFDDFDHSSEKKENFTVV